MRRRKTVDSCQSVIYAKKKTRACGGLLIQIKMEERNYNWPVIWTSNTRYVDLETGEEITKHNAQTNYIIVKNKKNVQLNANETRGHIEHTKQCRRNPQLKLY